MPTVAVILSLLRAWRVWHMLASALAVVLIWLALPTEVSVPLQDGLASVVWPIAPLLFAAAVSQTAGIMHRELERTAVRPLLVSKLLVVLVVLVVASFVAAIGAWLFDPEIVIRNMTLLVGLGFFATAWLPTWCRWLPVVLLPLAMWLLGARPVWLPPASWAVLLHHAGSRPATATALVCAGAGLVSYLGRDSPPGGQSSRPRAGRRTG